MRHSKRTDAVGKRARPLSVSGVLVGATDLYSVHDLTFPERIRVFGQNLFLDRLLFVKFEDHCERPE
jgi:hypothetical protein